MLSLIWLFMVSASTMAALALGNLSQVAKACMDGAANAVTVLMSLAGPLCLWCGVGELMRRSGLRTILAKLLEPLLGRLFPILRQNADGFSALSANVTANLLGLGNAATPMGIEACKAMSDDSGIATDEQCKLVVMNTASIQLIPTTMAALRSGLGCAAPLDILPAVLLSSLCSVSVGLLACRLLRHG